MTLSPFLKVHCSSSCVVSLPTRAHIFAFITNEGFLRRLSSNDIFVEPRISMVSLSKATRYHTSKLTQLLHDPFCCSTAAAFSRRSQYSVCRCWPFAQNCLFGIFSHVLQPVLLKVTPRERDCPRLNLDVHQRRDASLVYCCPRSPNQCDAERCDTPFPAPPISESVP